MSVSIVEIVQPAYFSGRAVSIALPGFNYAGVLRSASERNGAPPG